MATASKPSASARALRRCAASRGSAAAAVGGTTTSEVISREKPLEWWPGPSLASPAHEAKRERPHVPAPSSTHERTSRSPFSLSWTIRANEAGDSLLLLPGRGGLRGSSPRPPQAESGDADLRALRRAARRSRWDAGHAGPPLR